MLMNNENDNRVSDSFMILFIIINYWQLIFHYYQLNVMCLNKESAGHLSNNIREQFR